MSQNFDPRECIEGQCVCCDLTPTQSHVPGVSDGPHGLTTFIFQMLEVKNEISLNIFIWVKSPDSEQIHREIQISPYIYFIGNFCCALMNQGRGSHRRSFA